MKLALSILFLALPALAQPWVQADPRMWGAEVAAQTNAPSAPAIRNRLGGNNERGAVKSVDNYWLGELHQHDGWGFQIAAV